MYTIQQVQAADFLLNKIVNCKDFIFHNKELKLVIELNGSYWYGDFLNYQNHAPTQHFIDDDGDVNYYRFYSDGPSATAFFKKITDAFTKQTNKGGFYSNPFKKISTFDLLFNTIFKIVDFADIKSDESPIYPYLLNAQKLDSNTKLPFINLENQTINVVSIIDITDLVD